MKDCEELVIKKQRPTVELNPLSHDVDLQREQVRTLT